MTYAIGLNNRIVNRLTGSGLLLVALYGVALPIMAAESNGGEVESVAIIGTENVMQMIWALVIVVLLILGLSMVLRKLNMVQGNANGAMKIIGRAGLE